MWELVSESTLDQNSAYKYILMSEFFAESCVVAKENEKVVGFITGFIPPKKPDTIFVWQIGVDATQRGKGLGSKLLIELVNQQNSDEITHVEATITPSNKASQALFERLAKNFNTECQISEFFEERLFPKGHEEEMLFRIGPIK